MKTGFLRLLSFYLKHSQRAVACSIVIGFCAGAISAALMALISVGVSGATAATTSFILAFAGLALLDLGAGLASGLVSNHLTQRTSYEMRLRLCRQVMAAPLRSLEEIGPHRVWTVLSQDVAALTDAFLQVPQMFIHLAVVLGCLAYLAWLSPALLGALVLILILAILSIKVPELRGKRYMRRAREEWDALAGHLHALTDGAKELRLHRQRRETFLTEVIQGTAMALKQNSLSYGKFFAVLNAWSQILYFIIIGLILFVVPNLGGNYSHRVLIGYALTVLYMRGHIIGLMNIIPTFNRADISLRKVQELGISLAANEVEESPRAERDDRWEQIELAGVTHSYYREKEDSNFTLGPISFSIRPGEVTFLVGGNGSGKTTLAKVLTGLYAPEGGEIRINGEAVEDGNRDNYRQYFSVIFADFYLFEQLFGLQSLDLDERAARYLESLHLSHKLKVQDGKLSTIKLSFGQRKRLALLTAYLEDRPIYVFDEWASGQDPVFKEIFYLQILPELKARGKSVVVISHDDRYYHVADRILKMDEGKISEQTAVENTLDELMRGDVILPEAVVGAI